MLRTFLMMIFAVAAMAMSTNARAASADDARQFVDGLGKNVLNIVNTTNGNEAQKQQQLQQMFVQSVDIPWMGKFALGHAWQQATPDQRTKYMQAYQDYLLAHYTTKFTDYTGAKYTITDVKSDEDGQFTVGMQIKAPEQSQDTMAGLHYAFNQKFSRDIRRSDD